MVGLFPWLWVSRGGRLLCLGAEGLALLRAVDAAQADTLRAAVVQNFDGAAVKDGPASGITLFHHFCSCPQAMELPLPAY